MLARINSGGVKLRAMMANQTCAQCGTELIAGTKFCRLCGLPASETSRRNDSEAATRTLQSPTQYGAAPTEYFQSQPTAPAYLAPSEMPPPPSSPNYNTGSVAPTGKKKRTALVIGLLALLLILPLISLVVLMALKSQKTVVVPERRIIVTPREPAAPPPPSADNTTPPPTSKTTINPALVYPGAETRMEMRDGDEGAMMQLRTSDSYDKVVAWYIATLKPSNTIKTPGPSVILRTSDMMVIITGAGGETNVVIKQGTQQ
jgi:hypothetical protein